jgi:hypothetical protein
VSADLDVDLCRFYATLREGQVTSVWLNGETPSDELRAPHVGPDAAEVLELCSQLRGKSVFVLRARNL